MKVNKKTWRHAVSVVLMIFCLIAMSPLSVFAEGTADAQSPIRINEVNSSPVDWVELMNTGNETIDLSGWELRDDSDDHRWRFPADTQLDAGALLVVDAKTQGQVYQQSSDSFVDGTFDQPIGLGGSDSVRLYNQEGTLVETYTWTEHPSMNDSEAAASWGRYPDGTGSFQLMPETKGQANSWYKPNVVINEVESNGDANDWVEIYNAGDRDVDLSGWYLLDNDPAHKEKVKPLAKGTILRPGECFVFEQQTKTIVEGTHFDFGLGNPDSVTIYNADDVEIAKYEWQNHAAGVYARIPDGAGELVDTPTSTKGTLNVVKNPVVINEVESNDPNNGPDWIELANPTDQPLDIGGLMVKHKDDNFGCSIPAGTMIPANGFITFDQTVLGFNLDSEDSVRIFEGDTLIASTEWTEHATTTWGLYPDVNGSEYRNTKEATKGSANKFAGVPDVIAWPGSNEITASDLNFLEDSSGLDFYNGKLYAVDNGTGKFWVMDVAKNGTLSFANGFENGKVVNFKTPSAKGADTEGITVDGEGNVYLASERDNTDKGVNYNTILKADVNGAAEQNALQQWDITSLLPSVDANAGIEAIEWVSNDELVGKLYDKNTGATYDPANYPNAIAGGLFFVALEANGHVYGLALNDDETATVVADIDSKLGGAMSLDYDTYEKKLWVGADNGYGNRSAQVVLNGTNEPAITHVAPPTSIDAYSVKANTEGFAIASPDYTVNNNRPVYRFVDGVDTGALTIGSLNYNNTQEHTHSGTLVVGKPATATEDGWHDYYSCTCGAYFEDQACTNEITDLTAWQAGAGKIPATGEAGPTITEGDKSTWTSETGGDLTFKSDADISEFEQVLVDGKVVDPSNYTVTEGSIVVTLKEAFLKTLSGGKHTVSIVSANGTATASFEVKADTPNTDSTTPDTGDTSNIYLWMILLAISGCGLAGAMVIKKKKITC